MNRLTLSDADYFSIYFPGTLSMTALFHLFFFKGENRMQNFFDKLTEINDAINGFIWVKIGLVLLIGTGIIMTCVTKFFQISHLKTWWKATIGGIFTKEGGAKKEDQPPDDIAVPGVMYGARGDYRNR